MHVVLHTQAAGEIDSSVLMLLAGAPSLRVLTGTAPMGRPAFLCFRLFGQLTTLNLNNVSGPVHESDMNAVLRGLSSLETLVWGFSGVRCPLRLLQCRQPHASAHTECPGVPSIISCLSCKRALIVVCRPWAANALRAADRTGVRDTAAVHRLWCVRRFLCLLRFRPIARDISMQLDIGDEAGTSKLRR